MSKPVKNVYVPLKACIDIVKDLRGRYGGRGEFRDRYENGVWDNGSDVIHALSELAGRVKVRKLRWEAGDGVHASTEYFSAESIVGTYWVIECQWGLRTGHTDDEQDFDTDEEAKAAAQADYDRRVLGELIEDAP